MYTSKTFFAVIVAEFPGYWIQDQHIYKLKFISTHGLKKITSINFFVRTKCFPEKSCSVANDFPWTDGRTTKANVRIPGDHSVQRSKCSQPGNLCNANLKRMTYVGSFTLDRCWSYWLRKQYLALIGSYMLHVFYVIYQTRKIVFDHISKHRGESWKYDALRSIFDDLQGVWKCGLTVSWVLDISSQSNWKLRREPRI